MSYNPANMDPGIYRDEAIKGISSPDQLDRLMHVTRPRGWIALGALGAVLAAALGWGIWGAVPTRVAGSGILISQGGGIVEIQAKSPGQLTEVLVKPGDKVEVGQAIAKVGRPDLALSYGQAQVVATELRSQRDQASRYYEGYLREQEANLRAQAKNFEAQARDTEENVKAKRHALEVRQKDSRDRFKTLETLLKTEEQLEKEGFLSTVQVEEMRERVQSTREDISKNQADLAQLDTSTKEQLAKLKSDTQQLEIKLLELKNQRVQSLDQYALKLVDAEQKVRQLAQDLQEGNTVVSARAGVVVEQVTTVGTFVPAGAPIVRVETGEQQLEAVIYVPAGIGKEVKVGLPAEVSPATVKKEEWGYIVGTVRAVGELAVSPAGMQAVLDNPDLVKSFAASGPLLALNVSLRIDKRTKSGFRWSSKGGPDIKVTPGTLASAQVIVREQPPITLVIPALKKFFGLD